MNSGMDLFRLSREPGRRSPQNLQQQVSYYIAVHEAPGRNSPSFNLHSSELRPKQLPASSRLDTEA